MAAVTTAAVGTAVSAYGVRSANRQGRRARNAQEQMHQDQMGLAQQQMDFGRDHYDWSRGMFDDYREQFAPVLGELTTEAMAARNPDYGQITADTTAAFDSARRSDQRNLERYGIRPGDGQFAANNRRYGIGQATAEVGARQNARRQAGDQRYNRLAQLYGIGAGLQGQAMQGMGQGMGAYQNAGGMGMNAMGQAAGMYGQQANTFGQLAGSNMAGMVNNLGNLVDGVMNQPAPVTGGPSFWSPNPGSMSLPGLPGQGTIGINRPGGP